MADGKISPPDFTLVLECPFDCFLNRAVCGSLVSVGVVPVRNDLIDQMRIALISGWVFLVVRYLSRELVS